LKGDATHWFTEREYAALRHRLEATHVTTEPALVETRRRVSLSDGREQYVDYPRSRKRISDNSISRALGK